MTIRTKAQFDDLVDRIGIDHKVAILFRDLAESTNPDTVQELGNVGTVTLTASGAVADTVNVVYLDHTSVAIAATAAVGTRSGLFIVKATTEPGVAADHTLTVSGGTLDGTNTIATFADINDELVIHFDGAGNGHIISNTGSVALS